MSAYIGDVVKNGLVLYLDAANSKSYVSGSSTWFDLSGNNNSGSLTFGPTFSSDVKGNMVFDGTNDHVILARPSIMSGSQVSFCVWVKITSTRDGAIIWLEDGNDVRYFSAHLTWGDNSIYFDAGNGQTGSSGGPFDRINKSTTAAERSGWHYWCFTKNSTAGRMRIYLDGGLWHSGTGHNFPVGTASVGLINKMDTVSYIPHHNNTIASIKFYNRELSAAEILENYNATKGRFDTPRVINSVQPRLVTNGLVMCLDAGNGKSYVSGSNTWFDLSGNNNSGSLSGPTYSSTNGGSIVFDGTDDQVLVTGSVTTSTATFCVWIRRNGNQTTYKGILFSRGTNTSGMNFSNSNQIGYHWNDASNTYNWNPPLVIPDLAWSMCVVSVSPTFATAYLCQASGISSATNVVNHGSTTLNNIRIANDSGLAGRFFKGNIAQSLIYNRALSASEVLQNYNATKGRFGL
jgi:hypothetical protein